MRPVVSRGLTALALLLLLATLACRGSFEPIDLAKLPSPKDHPQHGAVVLKDHVDVVFRLEDGAPIAEETTYRRVRLLSDAGRGRMHATAFYEEELRELSSFEARVVTPDGEVHDLDPDDALDTMPVSPGYYLYESSRVIHFDNGSVPVGSVVEVRYTLKHKDPHLWLYGQQFDDTYPVVEARLRVTVPRDWKVEHLARRLNEPFAWDPEAADVGANRVLTWHVKDVEPLPLLDHAPNVWARARQVALRLRSYKRGAEEEEPFPDVAALARWKQERYDPRAVVDARIRQIHASALKGAPPTPRERAARLYAHVRDKVTYCSIQVGMGGWIPHASDQTAALSYGDCKDKANILRALLKVEGIESRLATLYAHDGYPKRFALPVLAGNSNHAILVVELEDGPVVCDPTTRVVPFGELPFEDQGAELVVAAKEGEEPWMTTPFSPPEQNRETLSATGRLDEKGELTFNVDFEATGEIARRYRQAFLFSTVAQRDEALAHLWRLDSRHEVVPTRLVGEAPPPLPEPVSGSATLHRRRAVLGSSQTRMVRFAELLPSDAPDLRDRRRDTPVLLGVPRTRVDRFRVALPSGLGVEALPAPLEAESAALSWSLSAHEDGGAVVLERRIVVKQAVVEGREAIAALVAVLDQGRRFDVAPVVLSRHALRSPPRAPEPPAGDAPDAVSSEPDDPETSDPAEAP